MSKEWLLTREVKNDIALKWGESNPGIGGVNYVEEVVLDKAIPLIRADERKRIGEWLDSEFGKLLKLTALSQDAKLKLLSETMQKLRDTLKSGKSPEEGEK